MLDTPTQKRGEVRCLPLSKEPDVREVAQAQAHSLRPQAAPGPGWYPPSPLDSSSLLATV